MLSRKTKPLNIDPQRHGVMIGLQEPLRAIKTIQYNPIWASQLL